MPKAFEQVAVTATAVHRVAKATCMAAVVKKSTECVVLRVASRIDAKKVGVQFTLAGYIFETRKGLRTTRHYLRVWL